MRWTVGVPPNWIPSTTAPPAPSGMTAVSSPPKPRATPAAGQPGAAAPDRVSRWIRGPHVTYAPPRACATSIEVAVAVSVVADQAPEPGSTTPSGRTSCADGLLTAIPNAECHTQPLSSTAKPFCAGDWVLLTWAQSMPGAGHPDGNPPAGVT